MLTYITNSPEETVKLGEKLGKLLRPGHVVLLRGDLGAGKTCFASGVLQALGVDDYVTSPTYTLVNEYEANYPVAHFDLYRLDDAEQIHDLGFFDYLDESKIILIEWPERAQEYFPDKNLDVLITSDGQERQFTISFSGEEYTDIYEGMKKVVSIGN